MKTRLTQLAFIAMMFCLTMCSRSAPSIAYSTIQLNYYETDTGIQPRLNFFVIVRDDDGRDDFAELRLYNDDEGLMWSFVPATWTLYEEAGHVWIGSRAIIMGSNEKFPSGQWRAVIIDKGGDRSERTFGFDVPEKSRYRFPKLTITEGNYRIDSEYPENFFYLYTSDGGFRSVAPVSARTGTVDSLNIPHDVLSVSLWARDSEYAVSALTKPVAIR